MSFRITGLSPEPFRPLFALSDAELRARSARRMVADASPGFPDRITLEDIPVGTSVLLVNHVSMDKPSPYRATHAIFVREDALQPFDAVDVVPDMLARRLLSIRAFDADGMMLDADVTEGAHAEGLIERLLDLDGAAELHVHFARRGCFAARVTRS
jgi:hypothetical protein